MQNCSGESLSESIVAKLKCNCTFLQPLPLSILSPPPHPTSLLSPPATSRFLVCVALKCSSVVLDRPATARLSNIFASFQFEKPSGDTRKKKKVPLPVFVCWHLAGSTICSQLWEFSSVCPPLPHHSLPTRPLGCIFFTVSLF